MGGARAVPGRPRGGARRRCARARRRPVGARRPRRARSRVGARGMKVTALITAYNCERFIGEAVDSAIAQDYAGPLEVLVIDDGSTDGTAAELARRPATRVIRQPNAGYVAATERGVAEAILLRTELARGWCPLPRGIAFVDWYFAIRAAQE